MILSTTNVSILAFGKDFSWVGVIVLSCQITISNSGLLLMIFFILSKIGLGMEKKFKKTIILGLEKREGLLIKPLI